jgi:hypothetical protein
MLVSFVVAAGKKEQARSWARVEDGAVVAHGDGAPDAEADVTFTAAPADAQGLHEGTLDLSVAFMRGQVKMAGDFGALLQLLPLTHGDAAPVRVRELLPA